MKTAYIEEGTEMRNGQIVEVAGWYTVYMGQLIGPYETEQEVCNAHESEVNRDKMRVS